MVRSLSFSILYLSFVAATSTDCKYQCDAAKHTDFVIASEVVHDLVGIKEGNALPEEHMIECVCELLQAIGFTLDDSWSNC